jgi:RimJ/RimL family protein N-acetyltransferase
LVPIALEHAPAVQLLAADARIAATTTVPHPYPPDGAETWIRFTGFQRGFGSEFNYAVLDGGMLVGVCGVIAVDRAAPGGPRGEIGYWIGVPYWGRGYATAAVRELLRRAFGELGLTALGATCLLRNRASLHILEKAGFRRVGDGSLPGEKWTADDRCALFELARDEWLFVSDAAL